MALLLSTHTPPQQCQSAILFTCYVWRSPSRRAKMIPTETHALLEQTAAGLGILILQRIGVQLQTDGARIAIGRELAEEYPEIEPPALRQPMLAAIKVAQVDMAHLRAGRLIGCERVDPKRCSARSPLVQRAPPSPSAISSCAARTSDVANQRVEPGKIYHACEGFTMCYAVVSRMLRDPCNNETAHTRAARPCTTSAQ